MHLPTAAVRLPARLNTSTRGPWVVPLSVAAAMRAAAADATARRREAEAARRRAVAGHRTEVSNHVGAASNKVVPVVTSDEPGGNANSAIGHGDECMACASGDGKADCDGEGDGDGDGGQEEHASPSKPRSRHLAFSEPAETPSMAPDRGGGGGGGGHGHGHGHGDGADAPLPVHFGATTNLFNDEGFAAFGAATMGPGGVAAPWGASTSVAAAAAAAAAAEAAEPMAREDILQACVFANMWSVLTHFVLSSTRLPDYMGALQRLRGQTYKYAALGQIRQYGSIPVRGLVACATRCDVARVVSLGLCAWDSGMSPAYRVGCGRGVSACG